MTQTCLVTGGAGFIGCAISDALTAAFDTVVAVDNLHPQIHKTGARPAALNERVELIVADVTEPGTWDEVLAKHRPDTVIHLAAETGTGQSLTEATRHAQVNVVGTTRMLDALAARGIVPQRIVLSSSRAVYGEGEWLDAQGKGHYPGQRSAQMLEQGQWDFPGLRSQPFRCAHTKPAPTSVYGATKLAQEHILSAWCLAFGTGLNILRLQNVYGPGQSLTNPYTGIVSLFARMAKAGKSIPLYEDGHMLRDFVFIDDVAAAIVAAATSDKSGILADIGTGDSLSIAQLASVIGDIYQAPPPHVTGQFRNGDVRHAACDVSATRDTLGWTPQVDAATGARRLCEWIDQRPEQLERL
ncbi:NAD-dependent epimerase/dehydratase family protein [Lysobacter firmicutimachus]|uniref:NAD-dependent epimerase/dehydratase family protein n=1 Tax=Lysobacter firmicutimachus TaxID=1792846 RepID=A0AAU8MW33_9GAMM